MNEARVATFECEWTHWYVVRVTMKDGRVGYLGTDAMGTYLPDRLPKASFFHSEDKERVMGSKTITFFKERGAEIHWCRVQLANADGVVIPSE